MTLSGRIQEQRWDVEVDTVATPEGGFSCRVRVGHAQPGGRFERGFALPDPYPSEREAILAGLREGMIWIEQKTAGTISVE